MLDDELAMLRGVARRVGDDFGPGYFLDRARRGAHTDELWQAAAGCGLLGVSIPEQYGGGGGGLLHLAAVEEELSAAGAPLFMVIVSTGIAASVIGAHGTEAQRQRWLPGLASGESVFGFAMTESEAGSNSHNTATSAERDGDVYRLNGAKHFISGVDRADALLLVARTGTRPDGRAALSLLVVDPKAVGVSAEPIAMGVPMPDRQFIVTFENVEVDVSDRIGAEGDGLRLVFTGLNPERVLGAAMACGLGRYALSRAATYARERAVWGQPIGSHQGIAHPLAEAAAHLDLARRAVTEAATGYDAGAGSGIDCNVAKLAAADAAVEAIDRSIQTLGGNGFTREYELIEFWGLARFLSTAPVSREMVLNHLAERSIGLPRSYGPDVGVLR